MPRKTAAKKARASAANRDETRRLDASSKRKAVDDLSSGDAMKRPRHDGGVEKGNTKEPDKEGLGLDPVGLATSKMLPKTVHQSRRRSESQHVDPDSHLENENAAQGSLSPGSLALEVTMRKPGETRQRPPVPPKAIEGGTTILPPEADDLKLRAEYDIHTLAVAPGAKIENRVRIAVKIMREAQGTARSPLLAITSMAKAANKGISVVEIAKRELLASTTTTLYQYTGCWTRLETQRLETYASKTNQTKSAARNGERTCPEGGEGLGNEENDSEDSEGQFEPIDISDTQKVRNAPCMVIYLSRVSIPRLKEKYGEQVHQHGKS